MVTKKKTKSVEKVESKPSSIFPIVVRGSHLTTTTYEDGTIELEWDDEQLLKEIREACASVEQDKPVTKKKVKK